jgi:hypothetical protein
MVKYRTSRKELHRRALHESALNRNELRKPSTLREPAGGVTSFPVKAEDPATQKLIEDFRNKQRHSLSWCPWCKTSHLGNCKRLISGGQGD